MSDLESLQLAARAVADADALIIGAGAGMGVDSGLPDCTGYANGRGGGVLAVGDFGRTQECHGFFLPAR
jgi:hypothetical protein